MSPIREVVAPRDDTRPVFVDESGRRARWWRRLLAVGTIVAVAFLLTVAVLGVAFTRSSGCDSWVGPDRQSTVAAPGCRP